MAIHPATKDRQNWYKELWEDTLKEFKDIELAKIIFRRLVFEEQ